MTDYWDLKTLFVFDNENLNVFNDTDFSVDYVDKRNVTYNISPKSILGLSEKNDDFNIPNHDTISFSNGKIHKSSDFDEDLVNITKWYRKQLSEGQIKKGIIFLEYHFKHTKSKKEFISFIKYYFLSQYWLPKENREKDWLIEEWIKSKEVEIERPKFLWIIGLILTIFIFAMIFLCEHRDIILGAILGIIIGRIDKLFDKLTE